jgi:pyruvate dehydrogenase E1 component beta subunit
MKEITYLKAINEAVDEEMQRDPTVFIMGEDVRSWGAPLGEFQGLWKKYGDMRVLDTPIAERGIMGSAIGAAETGLRPIAHIMFAEFLGVCWSEILNPLCKLRYMTGGKVTLPVTIMTPSGAGISAAGEHSSCLDGMLMGIVGLKVVVPSTPYDAKGLLKTAIRDDNPVIVIMHKKLLTSGLNGQIPEDEYTVPFGQADVKREGSDVTVVATLLMVHRALNAAEQLAKEGISVEVVDPRTLVPLDEEMILKSVKKTRRLVIMNEEPFTGGSAADISAMVNEKAFGQLAAPVKRVSAPDTPVPFSPALEKLWMPDEDDLITAVKEVLKA